MSIWVDTPLRAYVKMYWPGNHTSSSSHQVLHVSGAICTALVWTRVLWCFEEWPNKEGDIVRCQSDFEYTCTPLKYAVGNKTTPIICVIYQLILVCRLFATIRMFWDAVKCCVCYFALTRMQQTVKVVRGSLYALYSYDKSRPPMHCWRVIKVKAVRLY